MTDPNFISLCVVDKMYLYIVYTKLIISFNVSEIGNSFERGLSGGIMII